jgi:alpha-glucosidase
MADVSIPPEFLQDPQAVNLPEIADIVGRDPARTPMQWDHSPNAGFAPAGVQTWLPLAADYRTRNVAAQSQDPTSMLSFYRALTALRQASPALMVGDYKSLDTGKDDIFAYLRTAQTVDGEQRYLVVLNFGGDTHRLDLGSLGRQGTILLSTNMLSKGAVPLRRLYVSPNEGMVLAC